MRDFDGNHVRPVTNLVPKNGPCQSLPAGSVMFRHGSRQFLEGGSLKRSHTRIAAIDQSKSLPSGARRPCKHDGDKPCALTSRNLRALTFTPRFCLRSSTEHVMAFYDINAIEGTTDCFVAYFLSWVWLLTALFWHHLPMDLTSRPVAVNACRARARVCDYLTPREVDTSNRA
jgi:hypothetical protein